MAQTPSQQILVNGKPFMGRVEEQKQFRAALAEVIKPPKSETLPYIFLLYGDGGIGKTTLARRFRDIAAEEEPYKGKVQLLWVDWEAERELRAELRVGREQISPEAVFDTIITVAKRQGWEKYFKAYTETQAKRRQAEQQVTRALDTGDERDELARQFRGAGASIIAKILRYGLVLNGAPDIGDGAEELAKTMIEGGVQIGAEGAAGLRAKLEQRVKDRLDAELYEIFVNPHEALARALAEGLKHIVGREALLIVLDTYEIVNRVDPWMQVVMNIAGPHLLWVVSGRNDLRKRHRIEKTYFRGYSEGFSRRLVTYDVGQLAIQDVYEYFAFAVPERPLEGEQAEKIRCATHGIPLAMGQAADMWKKGIALSEIIGDCNNSTPRNEIVRGMTQRYLSHAIKSEDQHALYVLALANGDRNLLTALLRPDGEQDFDLNERLERLERDYASVYSGEAKLHNEPQAFFLEDLKSDRLRMSDWVNRMLVRAEGELRNRLDRIQGNYFLLEDYFTDDDWLKAVVTLCDILFWRDETEAWRWLMPRFLEGLAYGFDLCRSLVNVASQWQKTLSADGKRRFKALGFAYSRDPNIEEGQTLYRELKTATQLGWMKGTHESQRQAILAWLQGSLLLRQDKYKEALPLFEKAERCAPQNCKILFELIGEGLDEIAYEYLWPEEAKYAVRSPEAVQILIRVTQYIPQKQSAWYRLGVAYKQIGNLIEAKAAYQRTIELDAKLTEPWTGLGNVYYLQRKYEEAIAAYRRAIELNAIYPEPWNGLGNVYEAQGKREDAIAAYQRAIELDAKVEEPWIALGITYRHLEKYEDAIMAYQKANELAPNNSWPWNNLGFLYMVQGRYQEAYAAIITSIEIDPKKAAQWNSLGELFILLGEEEKALDALQQSVELSPENFSSRCRLVGILRRLGREDKAFEQENLARQIMEKEKEYHLARFAAVCGNREEALLLLKIALEKKQESVDWVRKDPDFVSLHEDERFWELVGGRPEKD